MEMKFTVSDEGVFVPDFAATTEKTHLPRLRSELLRKISKMQKTSQIW